MSEVILQKATIDNYPIIKTIYDTSFPASERKSFSYMIELQQQGKLDFLIFKKDDVIIGIAITLLGEAILLDYYAFKVQYQNQGYGSIGLDLLKQYYQKEIYGEIESCNIDHIDHELRLKRKCFYEKNGMNIMPFDFIYYNVTMQLVTSAPYLSFETYLKRLVALFGKSIEEHIALLP